MSVYSKIAAVMKEVKYVQKTGYNAFHKYKYAKESDYIESIRPILLKHGLVVLPSSMKTTKDGEITTVEMNFDIIDTETGEKHVVPAAGQGADKGDKGIYKAITGAKKYFLGLAFLIETGDDAEADESTDIHAAETKSAVKAHKETKVEVAAPVVVETAAVTSTPAPTAEKKSFSFKKPSAAKPLANGHASDSESY